MNKTTIKRKILVSVLAMAIVSLSVFCAVAFGGLFGIRAQMQSSSERLGDFAAENSSRFLEREAIDKLVTKANARANVMHERLSFIAKDVAYFADVAEGIYKNAAALPPKPIPYTSSKNHGTLTMQLRSPQGEADYPRIKREADLLGNLTQTYESNSGDMTTMTVAVFIGTESGVFIIFDPFSDDGYRAFDPRERPWYVGAKERGGTFWTEPYIGAASGKNMVTCSHPVYGPRGELKGVTGIDVIIEDLNSEIVNTDGSHGYAFVVDTEGILILSKTLGAQEDGAYEKTNAYRAGYPGFNRVIDKMRAGESGYDKVFTADGEKYIAFAPIPAAGWSVAVAQPVMEVMNLVAENSAAIEKMTGETLSYVNTTIMVMFIIFMAVFALSLAAVVYFSDRIAGRITRPVVTLEDSLRRIAGGELDTTIELKTGDEIERLGDSVNTMARDLKEYIRNLQNVTAEKERIGAELDVARTIQAGMLPCIFPPFPDRSEFDIFALMLPAKEVGGDFYDFFFTDNDTLAVVMADVSGKGVPAALFMVIAKTLIKSNAQTGKSPSEVFETVNNILCENNETGMFVTAFMGFLDVRSGKFTFVNAGHTPPVLRTRLLERRARNRTSGAATTMYRAEGACEFIKVKPGFVIAGMEGMSYKQDEITLKEGDEIFLYTDGVTEAANNRQSMFGNKRLISAMDKYSELPINDYVSAIKHDIDDFTKGAEQADDITMLALRYKGPTGVSASENGAAGSGGDRSQTLVKGELTIDARTENLEAVHAFVREKLEAVECPMKPLLMILTAVEEVFVNIANYAYAPEEGTATIRVSVGEDAIIEFEDNGKPYDPLSKEDPNITASAEEREVGGLGIFMVKKIMDGAEYRREGDRNILTVRKHLFLA